MRTRVVTSIVFVALAVGALLGPWAVPLALAADTGPCLGVDNPRQAGHLRDADSGHSYTGVRGRLEGQYLQTCTPGSTGQGFTTPLGVLAVGSW